MHYYERLLINILNLFQKIFIDRLPWMNFKKGKRLRVVWSMCQVSSDFIQVMNCWLVEKTSEKTSFR